MKNISKYVYSTLASDTTLRTLLGGSSSDPRVYFHFPSVENFGKLTESAGAIISFYLSGSGGIGNDAIDTIQRPNETYSIDIWSYVKSVLENCFERVDTLLNLNWETNISGWKVRGVYRVSQLDLYEEQDHIYRKHLEYEFRGILDAS